MRRDRILAWTGWLLAGWVLSGLAAGWPAAAAELSGGVEVAYEYFDADQAASDDAQARLRQTYLLNAAGDLWAPEVASYRSSLRYDAMTQSWEYPGGTFNNGVRYLNVETRIFPMSPLGFVMGGSVRSSRDDQSTTGTSSTAVDEVNLFGRMWFSPARRPSTSLQLAHTSIEGRRFDLGVETLTRSSSGDTVSVSTSLRSSQSQVNVSLQAGRAEDSVLLSETLTRAARVQYSAAPRPNLNVRASVDASDIDTAKPDGSTRSENQNVSLRVGYQMRQDESLQVAVSGGRTRQDLTTGDRDDSSRSVAAYYARPLGRHYRGLLVADHSQTEGVQAGGGTATSAGRTSLRGEVSTLGLDRVVWVGALTLDSVREADPANPGVTLPAKPGAALDGRVDYQLRPRLTVSGGASLYRAAVDSPTAGVEAGRMSAQASLRWSGGRTGQASLGVMAASRDYADGARGTERRLTASAGVSPRDDLDLLADVQVNRSETPGAGVPWQQSTAVTAGVVYRPRVDLNVTGNLSYQRSETTLGPKHQTSAQVKTEYTFYALKVGGLVKLSEIQELGLDPRRSLLVSAYARRDF